METPDYRFDDAFVKALNRPEHKKFCVLPFIHFATTTEGTCRLCCKVFGDLIVDDNGNPYNVNTHSVEEIWNSNYMRDVRLALLNDKQIPQCQTCWREEDIFFSEWNKKDSDDLPSKRRKENQKWLHNEKTKLNEALENTVLEPRIRYYDIRLSNLCNLKCRMCWPRFSSQIQKEQQYFKDNSMEVWHSQLEYDEWDTSLLWEGINSNALEIEEIAFVGGEPTLHEEIYDLIESLIEKDVAKNVTLKFTTNLTNLQERFVQSFKHFKKVTVNVSVDGYKDVCEYIRFPIKWTQFEEHLNTLCKQGDNVFVNLSSVIQIYNVFDITNLVTWYINLLDSNPMYRNLDLDLDLLYEPAYLDVRLLNYLGKEAWYKEVLVHWIKYYEELMQDLPNRSQLLNDKWKILDKLNKTVVNVALYMEILGYNKKDQKFSYWFVENTDIDNADQLREKCQRYTEQLDKHRKQEVTNIFPKFYEYTNNIESYNNE
jgi:MoaA/NifB/PqqE/SkfB family radical SAM enzyme